MAVDPIKHCFILIYVSSYIKDAYGFIPRFHIIALFSLRALDVFQRLYVPMNMMLIVLWRYDNDLINFYADCIIQSQVKLYLTHTVV